MLIWLKKTLLVSLFVNFLIFIHCTEQAYILIYVSLSVSLFGNYTMWRAYIHCIEQAYILLYVSLSVTLSSNYALWRAYVHCTEQAYLQVCRLFASILGVIHCKAQAKHVVSFFLEVIHCELIYFSIFCFGFYHISKCCLSFPSWLRTMRANQYPGKNKWPSTISWLASNVLCKRGGNQQ